MLTYIFCIFSILYTLYSVSNKMMSSESSSICAALICKHNFTYNILNATKSMFPAESILPVCILKINWYLKGTVSGILKINWYLKGTVSGILKIIWYLKGTVSVISSDPPKQSWQCPNHNCILETFIWSIIWKILSFFEV